MSRREFLESTAKTAATQALKPKIDLGSFNESPLTSALTDQEAYSSGMLANAAADFVKRQLSGLAIDDAIDDIKSILEDDYPELVEKLDNEPNLVFGLDLDDLDPRSKAKVSKVYNDFLNVDKLADETGIPANVFRAHGINEQSMFSPLNRIADRLDDFYSSIYLEEPHYNASFDQLSGFLTDEKMDAVISDAVKNLPSNPTKKNINAAVENAYNSLRDEFVADATRFGSSSPVNKYETVRVNDEWVERPRKKYTENTYENENSPDKILYDSIFNVGVNELRDPALSVWDNAQHIVGSLEWLIKNNIKARLAGNPLTNINDYEFEDYTNYIFENDDRRMFGNDVSPYR